MTSFDSVNGPSVIFGFPPLYIRRAPFDGGVRPSIASSIPAFFNWSLYFPISANAARSCISAGLVLFGQSLRKMTIMKRIVFSLSFERSLYQCRYVYIGPWTALASKFCVWLAHGATPLTRRTGRVELDRPSILFFRRIC